jgi:hypothetical protein
MQGSAVSGHCNDDSRGMAVPRDHPPINLNFVSALGLNRPSRRLSPAAHNPATREPSQRGLDPPSQRRCHVWCFGRDPTIQRDPFGDLVDRHGLWRVAQHAQDRPGAFAIAEHTIALALDDRANPLGMLAGIEHAQGAVDRIEVVANLFEALLRGY